MAKGDAVGGANAAKKNGNKGKGKDKLKGVFDPVGGATVNPLEGGYFDQGSTYGEGNKIVGADPIGKKKDRPKDAGATDNVFTDDEKAFSNTDPEAWAKTWLGGEAGGGLAVDPNSAFGDWFDGELQNVIGAWQQASGEGMNPNLSFASFLQTLGLPGGATATDLLRQRWRAALPSATGYSESNNGAGPTRWSVW